MGKKIEPARERLPLPDQLRKIITDSGVPVLRIAKATGVSQPTICRFMKGKGDLVLSGTLEKIAVYMGLSFTKPYNEFRPRVAESESAPTSPASAT